MWLLNLETFQAQFAIGTHYLWSKSLTLILNEATFLFLFLMLCQRISRLILRFVSRVVVLDLDYLHLGRTWRPDHPRRKIATRLIVKGANAIARATDQSWIADHRLIGAIRV